MERTEPIGFGYEYTDVGRDALSPVTGDYPPGDTAFTGTIKLIELLIVDEPTSGLDPEERIRFRTLLPQLAERRTVLLSTHIVGDVARPVPSWPFSDGAEPVVPTLEDGYVLLAQQHSLTAAESAA